MLISVHTYSYVIYLCCVCIFLSRRIYGHYGCICVIVTLAEITSSMCVVIISVGLSYWFSCIILYPVQPVLKSWNKICCCCFWWYSYKLILAYLNYNYIMERQTWMLTTNHHPRLTLCSHFASSLIILWCFQEGWYRWFSIWQSSQRQQRQRWFCQGWKWVPGR